MSDSIGPQLRTARETRGLALEAVEKAIRIRVKYLEALEAEQFELLPSEVQARGFLRNYAEYLGLATPPLLEQYAARQKKTLLPVALAPAKPAAPTDATSPSLARPRRLQLLSPDVWVAVIATFILGALLLWAAGQLFLAEPEVTPTPTVAVLATAVELRVTDTAVVTPEVIASPTIELPPTQAAYTGVNLILRAEQRSWVRVLVDRREVFAGQLPPGEFKEFTGQSVIEVVTSNGQGTRVIWNGRDQGTLGTLGEVVVRQWTTDAMLFPTPTNTVIPSATPVPTRTPQPTRTPRP